MAPKVSVIIPNYNHARFLDQRIQSVLNQTLQDFEVICLNDASTDNSDEILQKYSGDSRVRFIKNPVNSGSTFKQWNKGVKEAHGEYIWIAESDDYADERLLATLVGVIENNSKVGLAYCQSICVDEDDDLISTGGWWTVDIEPEYWKYDYQTNGKYICSHYLSRKNIIPNASAVVFRKSVYLQTGGADESMKACGDWLCWIKCLMVSDIAYVAEPLNFFRQHKCSVTKQKDKNGVLCLEGYRVLKFMKQHCSVEELALRKGVKTMHKQWKHTALQKGSLVSWRRNLQIYLLARSIDPTLDTKVIKKIKKVMFCK